MMRILFERGRREHRDADGHLVGHLHYAEMMTRHKEIRIGWMTTRPLPSLYWLAHERVLERDSPPIVMGKDSAILHIEVRIWRICLAALIYAVTP